VPVIAVLGLKGGTGKTTTTCLLAAEWHRRGRKVLVLDGDVQRSACYWAQLGFEKGQKLPLVLSFIGRSELPRAAVQPDYDVVLVDCPPNQDDDAMKHALGVAHLVLLPTGTSPFELRALRQAAKLVRDEDDDRTSYTVFDGEPEEHLHMIGPLEAAVLLTRRAPDSAEHDLDKEPGALEGLDVLKSELRLRSTYVDALANGTGVVQLSPSSAAAKEVAALADELEARLKMNEPQDRNETTQRVRLALESFYEDGDTMPGLSVVEKTDKQPAPDVIEPSNEDNVILTIPPSTTEISSRRTEIGRTPVRGLGLRDDLGVIKADESFEQILPAGTKLPHRRTVSLPVLERATSTAFGLVLGKTATRDDAKKITEVVISNLSRTPKARKLVVHLTIAISGTVVIWTSDAANAPEIVAFIRALPRR
jgi:chromosome partitioning protein